MRLSIGLARLLAPALLGLAAGCGGESTAVPPGPPPPPPPPPPPAVASVTLTAPATVLSAGEDLQVAAVAKDAGGATLSGRTFTWISSASAIATVDGQGRVHGVAAGSTTITASTGGQNGTLALAVRDTTVLGTALSGRIERVRLVLAAGKTYRTTGDVVLVADSSITIDGNLELGGKLSLYARGSIDVTGTIDSAPSSLRLGLRALGPGDPPPVVMASGRISLRGTMKGFGGLYLAGVGTGFDHVIIGPSATITAAFGARGQPGQFDGGAGFPIEIGTAAAQNEARAVGPAAAVTNVLIVGSTVYGGAGGTGYPLSRADGTSTGTVWSAKTGSGGDGGAVNIATGDLEVRTSVVSSGSGGDSSMLTMGIGGLDDGTGPLGKGESMVLETGKTGSGGAITVTATRIIAADFFFQGNIGTRGKVTVTGGRGSDGGPGGDITIRVGDAGVAGVVTGVSAKPGSLIPGGTFELVGAINGGRGDAPARPGGPGGALRITGVTAGADSSITQVTLSNVGNGGAGKHGCVSSIGVGGAGGRGGLRSVGVAPVVEVTPSFGGGNAGDGFPTPGAAGVRGTSETGPIGVDGRVGRACVHTNLGGSNVTGWVQAQPPCTPPFPFHTFGFTIFNDMTEAVAITVTSPHSGFSFFAFPPAYLAPLPPALGALSQLPISSRLNPCTVAAPFSTIYRITATHAAGVLVIDIPVTFNP